MTDAHRMRRAAGTRSAWAVVRTWSLRPSSRQAAEDLVAVAEGQSRVVSCFLRADFGPYPRRLTQGRLELSAVTVTWKPAWGIRRDRLRLALAGSHVSTRDAGHGDRVKKGGTFLGIFPVPKDS
jgi:hypothetical protein